MAIVSVNELVTTCQKIAQVYGDRWGADSDLAELICWLEINGFHGLKRFRQMIDNDTLADRQPVQYRKDHNCLSINALGQSAITFALVSLDFAKALAEQQERADDQPLLISYVNTADSIVLLAATAQAGFNEPVSISGSDNGMKFFAVVDRDSVEIASCEDSEVSNPDMSQIKDIKDAKDLNDPVVNTLTITVPDQLDSNRFADFRPPRRFNHRQNRTSALADGIFVDPRLWQRILHESKRILVPASEHSRRFGTGGGNAND